jgi:hypothetical protein
MRAKRFLDRVVERSSNLGSKSVHCVTDGQKGTRISNTILTKRKRVAGRPTNLKPSNFFLALDVATATFVSTIETSPSSPSLSTSSKSSSMSDSALPFLLGTAEAGKEVLGRSPRTFSFTAGRTIEVDRRRSAATEVEVEIVVLVVPVLVEESREEEGKEGLEVLEWVVGLKLNRGGRMDRGVEALLVVLDPSESRPLLLALLIIEEEEGKGRSVSSREA